MTIDETLKLIAQQWCNLSDLMKLANIERYSALAIKCKIKNELEKKDIISLKMIFLCKKLLNI